MNFEGADKDNNELKIERAGSVNIDFYNEILNLLLLNQAIKSFKFKCINFGRGSFFLVTQINGVYLDWNLIDKNFKFDYLIDKMIKADVTEYEFEMFIRMIDLMAEKTKIMLYMHCEKSGLVSSGTIAEARNKDIEMNNIK